MSQTATNDTRVTICAFCERPITRENPPVPLNSGESVHIDCYLWFICHRKEDLQH